MSNKNSPKPGTLSTRDFSAIHDDGTHPRGFQHPKIVNHYTGEITDVLNIAPDELEKFQFITDKFNAEYTRARDNQPIPLPYDPDNAIWMISGCIFGSSGDNNPLDYLWYHRSPLFWNIIQNPTYQHIITRGILHFCTKGTMDTRLINFIRCLDDDHQEFVKKAICQYLGTRTHGPSIYQDVWEFVGFDMDAHGKRIKDEEFATLREAYPNDTPLGGLVQYMYDEGISPATLNVHTPNKQIRINGHYVNVFCHMKNGNAVWLHSSEGKEIDGKYYPPRSNSTHDWGRDWYIAQDQGWAIVYGCSTDADARTHPYIHEIHIWEGAPNLNHTIQEIQGHLKKHLDS